MANEGRILVYFDELVMSLAKTYGETMDTHIYSPRDILSSMQGLHRVDAVEVVRCKDCKFFTDHWVTRTWCDWWGVDPDEDDFCSQGERREGE